MIDIGHWSLENRKLVNFLLVVLVISGVLAFDRMSKLEDPEIKVGQAVVVTLYPGASAHEVEMEVTEVLEKRVRSMSNIHDVQSYSMNDVSILQVRLETVVPPGQIEQQWDILRRKVTDARGALPGGAGEPVVIDDFGDVFGMFYAMTSDGFPDREMGDYAELVKREIQNIEGISRVEIFGQREECVNIELREEEMARLGVHPAEVLLTLKGQNETIYPGYHESGDLRVRLAVSDRYKTVEDIKELLLQGHESDQLRLKDIARVRRGYEDPARARMFHDGRVALGISIAARSGTDITRLGRKVEATISRLQEERVPAGIDFHKVFFQPERVSEAIGAFIENLIEAVLIVIFVLMLTMGLRGGLIICTNLIIIVFSSFTLLNLFDGTLQRVSLGALIVALGMLVDDAIVVIDRVQVDLKRGTPKDEVLRTIGRRTAMPLLGATTIAVLAFLPIALSPDMAGVYVRDLFIVLAVSLMSSWVLALTHVPVHAARSLKVKGVGKDPFDNAFYRALRRMLSWTLRHKGVTAGVAVALVAASGACYHFLPREFFPDMVYNQFFIEYRLPAGTRPSRVAADIREIEGWLLQREEVTHVTTSLGATPGRYNLVRSVTLPSLSYGELIVDFTDPKSLVANLREIQEYLIEHYPRAYARVKRYNLMYKRYPVELQFNGPDPAVLKELTAAAEQIMRDEPRAMLACRDWEPETPVLEVDYHQPVARGLGLSRRDVGLSLLAAAGGIPTGFFYEGQHRQNIYLKSVDRDGNPVSALRGTPVFSMIPPLATLSRDDVQEVLLGNLSREGLLELAMRAVPLSQATNGIALRWEDPVVVRYNGQRAMRAQCEPAFGCNAGETRQAIAPLVEALELPPGYSMQWEGEYAASNSAVKYLFRYLPLAILLMIAILIGLFKDYRKPAIIFCCIPLLLVGVILGMWIAGKAFGFVAIVGVLGLVGMMARNGIVLVDEIDRQIAAGTAPVKALLDGSASRFRPVMMASLCTILGMIPLVPDELFGALAVTIMGGLLIGTLVTLLFIPTLYAIFFGIKTGKGGES
ncbi:MAG: efflux RND transporter permease subunit [Odoribacteraceae bacterium]|jgi:multidrug efflux pump subunit AcrB|nr:efflux RND transporter permease subunit [Odoribacteraceae bacterium]